MQILSTLGIILNLIYLNYADFLSTKINVLNITNDKTATGGMTMASARYSLTFNTLIKNSKKCLKYMK